MYIEERKNINIHYPLCSEDHTYHLKIKRSISMSYSSNTIPKSQEIKIVHLFTCPKTDQGFKEAILLTKEPDEHIFSVDVVQ